MSVVNCSICLEDVFGLPGKKPCSVNSCGHVFHNECIDDWMSRNRRCPICRNHIDKINVLHATAEAAKQSLNELVYDWSEVNFSMPYKGHDLKFVLDDGVLFCTKALLLVQVPDLYRSFRLESPRTTEINLKGKAITTRALQICFNWLRPQRRTTGDELDNSATQFEVESLANVLLLSRKYLIWDLFEHCIERIWSIDFDAVSSDVFFTILAASQQHEVRLIDVPIAAFLFKRAESMSASIIRASAKDKLKLETYRSLMEHAMLRCSLDEVKEYEAEVSFKCYVKIVKQLLADKETLFAERETGIIRKERDLTQEKCILDLKKERLHGLLNEIRHYFSKEVKQRATEAPDVQNHSEMMHKLKQFVENLECENVFGLNIKETPEEESSTSNVEEADHDVPFWGPLYIADNVELES